MAVNHDDDEAPTPLTTQLLDHLYNPTKLRAFATGVMLLIGYVGVFMPLSGAMDTTGRNLKLEQRRLELGCEVEQLRVQYNRFKNRLPKQSDTNEWSMYLMDGIRQFNVKQTRLDSDDLRDVGPYKAAALRIELEGSFEELTKFLNWLETNERLIRVDTFKIAPHRGKTGNLVMQLVVLGIMG